LIYNPGGIFPRGFFVKNGHQALGIGHQEKTKKGKTSVRGSPEFIEGQAPKPGKYTLDPFEPPW